MSEDLFSLPYAVQLFFYLSTSSTPTIMSVSFFDSANNVCISNSNFTGTLKYICFISDIDIILVEVSSTSQLESRQSNGERKRCPLPVITFEGRERTLEKRDQCYDPDVKAQRVFVLYGLGGSGKSQLAFKFVEECQKNHRYGSNTFD